MLHKTEEIEDWEQNSHYITILVDSYLNKGKYATILQRTSAIEIGFIDGILLLYIVLRLIIVNACFIY